MSAAELAPWQLRTLQRALDAHQAGRLTHALLIAGPALLGKREIARVLARRLLCRQATGMFACGRCRACELESAGTHPDHVEVTFELNDRGEPRSEIIVEQIRRLADWLVLTPQLGGVQVARLHPADALNRNAFNALLKTLEEPPSGRYLILVSDLPQRLPATIRSRCQRLDLGLPPRDEALGWLASRGVDARLAAQALDARRGHPGQALADLQDDGLGLRRAVQRELATLAQGRGEPIAALAQRWQGDRPEQRLILAAEAVVEFAGARVAGGSSGLIEAGLDPRTDPRPLAAWFDAANRAREQLRTPLRSDLILVELLLSWRDAAAKR